MQFIHVFLFLSVFLVALPISEFGFLSSRQFSVTSYPVMYKCIMSSYRCRCVIFMYIDIYVCVCACVEYVFVFNSVRSPPYVSLLPTVLRDTSVDAPGRPHRRLPSVINPQHRERCKFKLIFIYFNYKWKFAFNFAPMMVIGEVVYLVICNIAYHQLSWAVNLILDDLDHRL